MKLFLWIVSFFFSAFVAADEFDLYMGQGTSHWQYLTEAEDVRDLGRYRDLYRRHRPLLNVKASSEQIPKFLHIIWLGPRQFPRTSVDHIRSWIGKNPGWKVKFWTDRPRPAPCSGIEVIIFKKYPFPRLGDCYALSQNWGEKSDLLRFEILQNEGGVYADHDANCLTSFDGLHGNFDFYCGLEAPHPPFGGHRLTAGIGVLGSRQGHPVIANVIDQIAGHWKKLQDKYPGSDGYSQTQLVIERTYLPLTLALKEAVDQPGNVDIVLPAAYFFAKPGIKSLYSKHFFANSWADLDGNNVQFEKKTEKQLSTIDRRFRRVIILVGMGLFLNLAIICMGFILYRKQRII